VRTPQLDRGNKDQDIPHRQVRGRLTRMRLAQKKWGPALLPAPTAPSEGSAGVRSTWSPLPESFGSPLLDPGSPAQASHSTAPLPPKRSPDFYSTAPPEGSLVFRGPACPLKPDLANPDLATHILKPLLPAKAVRCSAALLGVTTLASRFALPHRNASEPRRARNNFLFRRPLPGWPRNEPESPSQLPAGGDRFFCPFLTLLAVAGLPERLGRPPRSLEDHALVGRVAKAKFSVIRLWITGILGTTVGTFPERASSCRSVLISLPLPSA
jgi:hypothetical protein